MIIIVIITYIYNIEFRFNDTLKDMSNTADVKCIINKNLLLLKAPVL